MGRVSQISLCRRNPNTLRKKTSFQNQLVMCNHLGMEGIYNCIGCVGFFSHWSCFLTAFTWDSLCWERERWRAMKFTSKRQPNGKKAEYPYRFSVLILIHKLLIQLCLKRFRFICVYFCYNVLFCFRNRLHSLYCVFLIILKELICKSHLFMNQATQLILYIFDSLKRTGL